MTNPFGAIASLSPTLLFALSLTAQAPLQLDAQLLLPTAPSVGPLRFAVDGSCSMQRPEPLDAWLDLSPTHQRMLVELCRLDVAQRVHGCWLQPPSDTVAALFNAAIQGPQGFQPSTRWSATATQGGGLGQGAPTTLTYSFVPDGTFIPSGVGEPSAASNLFAAFNASFPSQATWQNRIHDMFTQWGQLTGVTYVFETNDDGAAMFGNGGQLGVRGDVRIGGKYIDGGFNVLAYNYFPDGGDMVLDTADNGFFGNATNNYRRLFNTAAHEHGHGLGIAHVCPQDSTKLMEPGLNTGFNGPQFDDILTAQRLYGDDREPNDSSAQATDLGTLGNGFTNVSTVSIDGAGDYDYYRFTVASNKLLTVTLHNTGTPYLEGPQTGSCNGGATLDPSTLRNLNFLLLNSTGVTVLSVQASQPAGTDETLVDYPLAAGTYIVRVYGTNQDQVQMYNLQLGIVENGDPASATAFGQGCNGLTWTGLNRPLLGTTQFLYLSGIQAPPLSVGLMLLGYTDIPTGVDLGIVGAPGCSLYVDLADIKTAFPLTSSSYLWQFPIPNVLALSGATIHTQGGLLVPPGVNALGAITANAVTLNLGTL